VKWILFSGVNIEKVKDSFDKNSYINDSMNMNSRVVFAIVLILGIFHFGCAEGKHFEKDYSGIKSIEAVIETHEGKIVLDLDFRAAPNTVANFVDLADKGFYKGLTFHRVIPGFMIQGGDPEGNGKGGPGYTIDDEFSSLKHEAGVISMANRGPNTSGSQFFITQTPQHHLDGKHTVFGKVLEGFDVVCRIEQDDKIVNITIVEKK
jgi:peptidyl-prolyl cis-trans isomerase B (cyclophilin B)